MVKHSREAVTAKLSTDVIMVAQILGLKQYSSQGEEFQQ